MDILIHTLSGTTTAAFIAALSKQPVKVKLYMVLLGAFAGAVPDIDAISLWSKFDGTVGKWLHLSHTGNQIYFGKFWYSHHGFFHSLFAAALFAYLFVLIRKSVFANMHWFCYFKNNQTQTFFLAFFFAYVSHLIGDLPTPGAVWGGVRLFFPFEIYIGGYGTTWWWNNYDIFLSLLSATSVLTTLICIEQKLIHSDYMKLALATFLFCILACGYFATQHSISYAYSGNTSRYEFYERTSKIDQRSRLGKRVYTYMNKFDRKLPFYF
jgi:inner membrane protein